MEPRCRNCNSPYSVKRERNVSLIQSLEEKEKEAQESKREARAYRQQMEQKEREEAEKDQEIRRYRHQLQEKDRDHQVVLQELQEKDRELQEKDRELQEKDRELQEKDRELCESQDHWSINKDEVTLTKEELGRGSYAVVTVGIFRGLRVAVKSLHNIIISDYNLGIFSREMSIYSIMSTSS